MERLIIDTETTGFSPRFNRVLTVGMLLVDVEKDFLNIIDSNHVLIKHQSYNANPDSLRVNKINLKKHHKVADEPAVACKKINTFLLQNKLSKTPLVGHNVNFDLSFLNSLFAQGKSNHRFSNEFIDTMYLWNYLKKNRMVPFHLRNDLETVANFFEIDYTKAHDALEDCHITAKVYHKMLGLV